MDSIQRFETEAAANDYINGDNIPGYDAEAVERIDENGMVYWVIRYWYPNSIDARSHYLRESGYVS